MGPRGGLDVMEKRKIFLPATGIRNLDSPTRNLTTLPTNTLQREKKFLSSDTSYLVNVYCVMILRCFVMLVDLLSYQTWSRNLNKIYITFIGVQQLLRILYYVTSCFGVTEGGKQWSLPHS